MPAGSVIMRAGVLSSTQQERTKDAGGKDRHGSCHTTAVAPAISMTRTVLPAAMVCVVS